MSVQQQQPGVTPKKDTPAVQQEKSDTREAAGSSEWADEDEADIDLAESADDPDATSDVEDRKLKSARPAKQQ